MLATHLPELFSDALYTVYDLLLDALIKLRFLEELPDDPSDNDPREFAPAAAEEPAPAVQQVLHMEDAVAVA
ncbi:MAG: hypothetical protein Q4C53_08210 [Clostridia bacterium]|nr:hypothetical protein [Clostridia bacterium]